MIMLLINIDGTHCFDTLIGYNLLQVLIKAVVRKADEDMYKLIDFGVMCSMQ